MNKIITITILLINITLHAENIATKYLGDTMVSMDIESVQLQIPYNKHVSLGYRSFFKEFDMNKSAYNVSYYAQGLSESSWFMTYNIIEHFLKNNYYPDFGYKFKQENGQFYTGSISIKSDYKKTYFQPQVSFGYQI